MQSQKCKICGHRHHRYEPHAFDDPKVKLMYESEPSWPAEYPGLPAAPEDPRSNAQSPTPRTPDTEGCTTATALPSTADAPTPDTPDTAPLSYPRDNEELAYRVMAGPRKEVMPHKPPRRFHNATAPVTTAGADPPLAIVQEVIFDESDLNLGVPCFAPATWVEELPHHFEMLDAPTLAALDDTALRTLRNLVMNEWMRRERRRKRASRKEKE